MQGPRLAFVDNVQSAKNLLPAVLPDLGKDLPVLDNGAADDGVRQDLFHMLHRIFDLIPPAPGLKASAGSYSPSFACCA